MSDVGGKVSLGVVDVVGKRIVTQLATYLHTRDEVFKLRMISVL